MLIIRDQQMQVFSQHARSQFEAETVRHVSEFAPRQFTLLGQSPVQQLVSLGIDRSEKYGFTNRGPARLFIEMMFMFGSEFDSDPQYPWASELLSASEPSSQMTRAAELHKRVLDFLERVAGPEMEYERQALNRVVGPSPFTPSAASRSTDSISSFLKQIYPQKCEYIGETALYNLVQLGVSAAAAYPESPRAATLFTGLFFVFGHGCLSDPQFPWIANTLARMSDGNSQEVLEQLYSKTRLYLEFALDSLEGRQPHAPELLF